jgi:hypothetical protein
MRRISTLPDSGNALPRFELPHFLRYPAGMPACHRAKASRVCIVVCEGAPTRGLVSAYTRRTRAGLHAVAQAVRLSDTCLHPWTLTFYKKNKPSSLASIHKYGVDSGVFASSNRLLGFSQTITTLTGTKTNSTVNSQVNYTLDANGNLTSDGLRTFEYDASDRLSKVILGSTFVGTGFVNWLRTNFSWLWATAQTNATLGDSYLYADGSLPSWALLGEYGNGGVSSTGRTEYIWLPTQDGSAIPVGLYRSGKLHAA